MKRAELGSEWGTCEVCGRKRWCYSLERAPRATTWRKRRVRKGALSCIEHQAIFHPEIRDEIARIGKVVVR